MRLHPHPAEYTRGAVVSDDRRDWILWGAVGCALAGTAYSEWNLAVAVGAHSWVALAVPGALDLYVLRALQVRRDVFLAVLAMVAANVAWYLVHSGDLPIGWQLRSAVGALAPLILWRVHSLKYTRTRKELLWEVPAGAVSAPEEETEVHPVEDPDVVWVQSEDGNRAHPTPRSTFPRAVLEELAGAPAYVPQEWADQEDKRRRRTDAPAPVYPPYLQPVPDVVEQVRTLHPDTCPVGCECTQTEEHRSTPDYAVREGFLLADDLEYIPGAREYMRTAERPSARGMKSALSIGQERAKRLFRFTKGETL